MGSTKNCIYRATKRHLNIFDISSSLVVAPIWKWVHLFGPGSKIVLFANFHQFQIRIFTFDLIFGPETFVLSIFWRVTAQIRIERATQICFNFLDSSTGLVLTPHESWVPFLFPDRVSIKVSNLISLLSLLYSLSLTIDVQYFLCQLIVRNSHINIVNGFYYEHNFVGPENKFFMCNIIR